MAVGRHLPCLLPKTAGAVSNTRAPSATSH